MYGMVNKAIEEMISLKHGEATFDAIRAKAKVDIEVFISNDPYPDEITYRLLNAAVEELGIPADRILQDFGRHWILETARRGYAALVDSNGRSFREFLLNLPNFHTRVAMIFPHLCPPRFECTDVTENSMRLHYHTHRPGLTDFVVGLLDGLAIMFKTKIDVSLIESKSEGADHDVFLVRWMPPLTP